MNDDSLVFADESENSPGAASSSPRLSPWKILIADDENSVHLVTRLTLTGFTFQDRPIELFSAYGEEEVRRIMKENPDMALVLLDVVMDTITSGFDLVRYIRDDLTNKAVRIIMRTGQSGTAPEEKVIINYDINDFKDKTELTVGKLKTTVISSLRAYHHLQIIDEEQKKLAESRLYLREILNTLSSLVITLGSDCIVRLWNRQAEIWTGIPAEQAVGKDLFQLSSLFDPFRTIIESCMNDKKIFDQPMVPFQHTKVFFVHLGLYPLVMENELEVILRLDDVTDVKRKEDQLGRSQRLNALSSLSASFSSELGDLLGDLGSSLLGLESFRSSVPEGGPFWDNMESIRAASQKAKEILGFIVSLSKKPDAKRKAVDLHEILKAMVQKTSLKLPHGIELIYEKVEYPAYIYGSQEDVEVALNNVISNAVYALEKGGEIRLSLERVSFSPEYRHVHPEVDERSYWLIRVSDNGIGMSLEVQSKIFDPFFTTRNKEVGRGLGMCLVYNIMDLHNGFVDIYSEMGQGTVVQLYLPEEKPSFTSDQQDAVIAAFNGSGYILVCDDEGIMRRVAGNILKRFGFEVLVADDGATALEIYQKNHGSIRLVLLDMLMPQMNGLEVFREMKKINPGVRVLLSSGFGKGDRVQQALQEGVKGFLQKPYGFEKLGNAVFDALDS